MCVLCTTTYSYCVAYLFKLRILKNNFVNYLLNWLNVIKHTSSENLS